MLNYNNTKALIISRNKENHTIKLDWQTLKRLHEEFEVSTGAIGNYLLGLRAVRAQERSSTNPHVSCRKMNNYQETTQRIRSIEITFLRKINSNSCTKN